MKGTFFHYSIVLSVIITLATGCASSKKAAPTTAASEPRKGHWVTLPPVTGSYIGRQVWVEDNGTTTASPGETQIHSADAMKQFQRPGSTGTSGSGAGR